MGITTILIDDEQPALKIMGIMLQKYPQIEIMGQYLSPIKAIEDIKRIKPNLVMLDIDMPGINGMEAAECIIEESPATEIVFVTAYEEYALRAYEFHPMDYILKPVSEKRLDNLISYLCRKLSFNLGILQQRLVIRCFGDFYIAWEGQEPIKWRTEKTREIVAYLLDHYNRKVKKEEILESLWPEESPEKAVKQLYNGIYYIRKALYDYGIREQLLIDNSYHLIIRNADFDLIQFKALEQCDESGLEIKLELYGGLYFEKQDYAWLQMKREEFLLTYQKYLLKLVVLYQRDKKYEKAEMVLQKALREDPLNESIAEMLIKFYLQTKNKMKGIRTYQAYKNTVEHELNEKPSKVMMDYYQKLKQL